MMRVRMILLAVAFVVTAAGGTVGYAVMLDRHAARRPAPAASPAHANGEFEITPEQRRGITIEPVNVARLQPSRVAEGRIAINENRSTPVFSQYGSARVVRIFADTGDVVEKGAPLVQIETPDLVQAGNDLSGAAAGVSKARSQLKLAETSEARQHQLYDAKGASLRDWQQAQADLAAARSDLRSAAIALLAVRNRLALLGKTAKEIAILEASQAIDPATVIVAPIGGVVVQRKVGPGQYITASVTDPICVLGDLSSVWLMAAVKETDVPYVKLGQPVEVRVLAYPDRRFGARIVKIGSTIDPSTRRLQVRAEVENGEGLLKPEMFAEFRIATGPAVDAPAVPDSSIIYEGELARVWVATANDRFASRTIRVGIKDAGMVQVVSGLQPDDKLVTRGSLFIDRAARPD